MSDASEDAASYRVILNEEEQYSIWPADKELPFGWTDVGVVGSKDECLGYIKETWTDMRPLSLRRQMAEAEAEVPDTGGPEPPNE